MKVLALIPCRGGSKGIPRKNLAPLAGKPLLAWTIEQALAAGCLDRVVVSTEDEEIAVVARQWGAEVPFRRPVELASDEASPVAVALDALDRLAEQEDYRPDWLMLLQVTSPLRSQADIVAVLTLAQENEAEAVVSICPAANHPQWTFKLDPAGRMRPFIEDPRPPRRQELAPAFAPNGAIYLIRKRVLYQERTFLPEGVLAYLMPSQQSLDIDTPFDLHLANLILTSRLWPDKFTSLEYI